MAQMAKIFKNGASQAVRLPKEFRFDCDEVIIKKVGSVVLLYPKGKAVHLLEDPPAAQTNSAAAAGPSTPATGSAEDDLCVKRVGSYIMVFPKSKAWDLMKQAIGQFDDDFMRDRDQPTWAEERKPL